MASKQPTEAKFQHIYYDDWQIGATYERKTKDGVVPLGQLIEKSLCGSPRDPDIKLTFQRADGTQYQHVMEFDSSYRRVAISSV